ncbi:TPA: winged helix-turn-helix domain-containing protein [Photobacterium damselae]
MQNAIYCFNDVQFSHVLRTLTFDASQIQLDPKVADLLLFLIQYQPQVLSREEILNALWEGQDVSDHVVTQTISELRKALEKVHPKAKLWIKTISKRGYCLDVNVDVFHAEKIGQDEFSSIDNVESSSILQAMKYSITKKMMVLGAFLLVIVMMVSVGMYHYLDIPKVQEKESIVFHPDRMSFLVLDSEPNLDFMAFGLSDFLNYRINSTSEVHSTLVFNPKSELLTSVGTLIKGKLFKSDDDIFIEVILHNNITGKEIFRKTYSLSYKNLIYTPENIVRDILPIMNEIPNDDEQFIAASRYPTALPEISWMHQAHYALNQSDTDSLLKSIALYEQVLQRYPKLEIAISEQLIAIKLLRDMGDNSFSLEDLLTKNKVLREAKTSTPPPVFYEAKSIFYFNINDLSISDFYLSKAVDVRESWLSNVILGKIHESRGHNFKAGQSYAKAYSMKPDAGTLNAIENLLFKTDTRTMLNI